MGPDTDAPTARRRRTWALAALLIVLLAGAAAFVAVMVISDKTPLEVVERVWSVLTARGGALVARLALPLVLVAGVLTGLAAWLPRRDEAGAAIGIAGGVIVATASVAHTMAAEAPRLVLAIVAAALALLIAGWLEVRRERRTSGRRMGTAAATLIAALAVQAGLAIAGLGLVGATRSDGLALAATWQPWFAAVALEPWSAAWAVVIGVGVAVSAGLWWRTQTASDDDRPSPPADRLWGLALAWIPAALLLGVAWTALGGTVAMGLAVAVALPAVAIAVGHLALLAAGRRAPGAATTTRIVALTTAVVIAATSLPGIANAVLVPDWRAAVAELAPRASRWDALVIDGATATADLERVATATGVLDGLPPRMGHDDARLTAADGPFRVWLAGEGAAVPAGYVERQTIAVRGLALRLATRAEVDVDVAVYGATPSGIMAAIAARETGADVVLLATDTHVGGMTTGGLGHTDIGDKRTVGGLALEFYTRLGLHYEVARFGQFLAWDHEPSAAQAVLDAMLDEAGVRVLPGAAMDRLAGPVLDGRRIVSITTTGGARIAADSWVDATYEGDLLAAAGVPWTIGREAAATYGESLAGVRPVVVPDYKQQVFGRFYGSGRLLPGISSEPVAAPGTADERVQAYTFRVCVTDDPSRAVPFPVPDGYDRADFVLVERAIDTWTRRAGEPPPLDAVLAIARLPNGAGDLNNARLFSTDVVGESTTWAEADDAERTRIRATHVAWVAGLLHFLATDEAIPEPLRSAVAAWGLCGDEFAATGHWPPQLYVREARRMVGEVVLTQAEVQAGRAQPDPVAIGSYRIDNHVVQRVLNEDGIVLGEGSLAADVRPYHVPMRALVPPRGSIENLVVGVTVSTSHVAWSSLRMEPTFMMLGEAAGLIAADRGRDRGRRPGRALRHGRCCPARARRRAGPAMSGRLREWRASDWWFVLVQFALSRALYLAVGVATTLLLAAEPTERLADLVGPAWDAVRSLLVHGDSYWYRSIVQDGYTVMPFDASEARNWAFFPLFPVLVTLVGGSQAAGIALANVAALVATRLLMAEVRTGWGRGVARWTVLFLLFQPFSGMFSSFRPESLLLLFAVGAWVAARRGHWWLAFVCVALATLTRSQGVVVALLLIDPLWAQRDVLRRRPWPILLGPLLPIAALVGFSAYLGSLTGDPLAWAHIQAAWGRDGFDPLGSSTRTGRRCSCATAGTSRCSTG